MYSRVYSRKYASRIQTDEFDESIARNANKRRQEHRPIPLVPRLRQNLPSPSASTWPWYGRLRTKSSDDENPEQQDQFHSRPIQNVLDIPVSCRRATYASRKPLLFLTTRESSSSTPAPKKTGDMRWLHVQHSGLCFEEFINLSIGAAAVPATTKRAMKDWLSGLKLQLETSVFAGMTFPGTVKGGLFAAMDENKEFRAKYTCHFFTLPYFLLSEGKFPRKGSQTHPVRPLVETLYRNASPFSRELRQAVNQLNCSSTSKIIYVPHIWCLIINDEYVATSAPSQLHTCPTSYVVTVAPSEYPARVRLRLRWGLKFCIKLEECITWFEFLLKVHHIYSQVLRMHVDAENCTYWRASSQVDAERWTSIVQNENSSGTLIDIKVLLPGEDTSWEVFVSRKILQEYEDISGLPPERVSRDAISLESLEAFNIRYTNDHIGAMVDVNESNSPALVDRLADHTETRRVLEHDEDLFPTRPTQLRTRRGTRISGYSAISESEDSEDQKGSPSIKEDESKFSFASLSPNVFCIWPGCYGNLRDFKSPGRTKASDGLFWIPFETAEIPPPTAADDGPQAYLNWPIYCRETTRLRMAWGAGSKARGTREVVRKRRSFSGDAGVSVKSGDNTSTTIIDTSPAAQLHRALSNRQLYEKQDIKSKSELDALIHGLTSAGTGDLVAFAAGARDLIDHFIPMSEETPVKQKAFGALCGILEKCGKFDRETSETYYPFDQTCKEIERALSVSQSIRQGIHGRQGDISLLKSLVIAFKLLVLRLVYLNDDLRQEETTRRKMTASNDSGDEEPSDVRPRREPQSSPSSHSELESGGSASKSDIGTSRSRLARDVRRERYYRAHKGFRQVRMTLEASKADILQLLESQHSLDLASFSTVNASGILASVITSLVHGDYDLPLPLGPENSYLSSMFTTSACDDSNEALHLNIGAIYQEYCSRLRLTVRDHPSRSLLDDLDLADEELDSIISATETQLRVIKAFQVQSPQRQPTQNDWYWELSTVCKMLEDNVGVYNDLKIQIDKLKRQVTLQVELKQDNNGKAILVFTIVTVIFLPLSFMTSYFGMNTPDIRDMAIGQWIFWAISVPLTISVVAFCMTIAYQGQKIQEYFHRL